MTGRSVDQDGIDSPHPAAFLALYDAFRALGCTTALDPADADDCASVADEAVRALTAAGLLVAPTARSLSTHGDRDA